MSLESDVLSAGDWRSQQRRSTLLSLLSFDANNLSLSFYTSIWSGDGLKISGDGCMSYQKFFIPLHSITVLECFRITFRLVNLWLDNASSSLDVWLWVS